MTVIIQAGHEHIETNCEQDLQSGTGAPGEIEWTPQIADRVVARLKEGGVDARHVDADFNCAGDAKNDWQAVVAVHYQSDPPAESGFWCGVGNPNTDGAAHQSWELQQAIVRAYGAATGLQLRPTWDSVNITEYYLFNSISGPTPFALIECGTGAPGAPDHALLWDHMDKVAEGIAQGIAAFVGAQLPAHAPAPEPAPAPPPPSPPPTSGGAAVRTLSLAVTQVNPGSFPQSGFGAVPVYPGHQDPADLVADWCAFEEPVALLEGPVSGREVAGSTDWYRVFVHGRQGWIAGASLQHT